MRRRTPARPVVAASLASLLLLTGCGGAPAEDSTAAAPSDDSPATDDDHGEMDGAQELAEPALGLTTVDRAGRVEHLDLADESVRQLDSLDPPAALHTDGRYLFASTDGGVQVLDSGVWTWDHVDHFHYYRAEPRVVGTVEGDGRATVATTNLSHAGSTGVFFAGSGEAVLLDTDALADGELSERFRIAGEPHDGMVVPVGDHALVTRADDSGGSSSADEVVAVDTEGEPLDDATYACPTARGTITTRVGAVIGCADGALLAVSDDDGPTVTRIPYPAGTDAPPATVFANREGRPTVAALAGPRRYWLLDTREQSWQLRRSPVPLVQVSVVDDDEEHVLGLTREGAVAVLDGVSGDLLATTEPLVRESLRAGVGQPTLVLDQQRAYLSGPSEQRLFEIDFADDARVSRTFETTGEAAFTAGTGR